LYICSVTMDKSSVFVKLFELVVTYQTQLTRIESALFLQATFLLEWY
jgi:hypothetical protein